MTIQEHPDTQTPVEMVTLTIDDVEVTVPKGTLLIRAAEVIGVEIPRFCDHPLLDPVGACRQCLVDIPDAGNGRGMPKPQASCTIEVADGTDVVAKLTPDCGSYEVHIGIGQVPQVGGADGGAEEHIDLAAIFCSFVLTPRTDRDVVQSIAVHVSKVADLESSLVIIGFAIPTGCMGGQINRARGERRTGHDPNTAQCGWRTTAGPHH